MVTPTVDNTNAEIFLANVMAVLNVIAGPGPRLLGHIRLLEPENGPRTSGVRRSSAFSAFDVTPSCQSYLFESGVHKVAAGHRLVE
jgi:hypothetical protein